MKNFSNKLVNWQDSMNVSAKHFLQTENYFIEALRDVRTQGLNKHNFGLLPANGQQSDTDGIKISEHPSGHIEIRLLHCNAITRSGLRIAFHPDPETPLVRRHDPTKDKDRHKDREISLWDIIVVANPFKRIPTGEPDPEENPPRHPDAEHNYDLMVVPSGEIDTLEFGNHHLIIGRIRKKGDQYEVDHNYIPPCTSMNAHPELVEYHNKFAHQLIDIEKNARNIIAKIYSRSNETQLAGNIMHVCRDLLSYLSGIYFNYRNKALYMAPVDTINYISTLAHTLYISISTISGPHKEELLNYFYEWSDVTPGSFEDMLARSMQILYEHGNIRTTMLEADILLSTIGELWSKLSQLEYIGQHKESIVVSETSGFTAPRQNKTGNYSIFD